MSLIYLNILRAGMTARRRKNSKWAWLSYRDCSTVRVQNRPTLVQYTAHVHIMREPPYLLGILRLTKGGQTKKTSCLKQN